MVVLADRVPPPLEPLPPLPPLPPLVPLVIVVVVVSEELNDEIPF